MIRRLGPLENDHPLIGVSCPSCRHPFAAGQDVTLVAVGPGELVQRPWNKPKAAAAIVHYDCATRVA